MAITNLTNTIWVFKSSVNLNVISGGGQGSVHHSITFISNNITYSELSIYKSTSATYTYNLYYDNTSVLHANWSPADPWTNSAFRIIKITGGTSVTNADLIAWLEANATQVNVTDLTNTKWAFNDNITISSDVTYGLSFTSNNTSYTSLRLKRYYDSDFDEYMPNIYYNNDNVYGAESTGGGEASNWNNQAYKTIEISNGTDIANPDLIVWLTENATLQTATYKTFDLSTLQLSAGTHTVQVRARAQGYKDSIFSNSVSYTKQVNNIKIHFVNKGYGQLGYRVNNGSWVWCPTGYQTLDATLNNVAKFEVVIEETGGVDGLAILTAESGGTIVYQTDVGNTTDNPLDITEYLQDGYYISAWADD